MTRRWFVPETVQTSTMDCGPVVLQAALFGFGIDVDLGRLRTAVATDVDGTSIDTLETVANELGLEAVQTLVPLGNLRIPEACPLPFVVVVTQADGRRHFVLVWRRLGPYYQVLDPSRGRVWMHGDALLAQVYRHRMLFPQEAVRGWSASPGVAGGLAARLVGLGLPESAVEALLLPGLSDPHHLEAVERCTNTVEDLRAAGGVRRGAQAAEVLRSLLAEPSQPTPDSLFHWQPAGIVASGAVVLLLSAGDGQPASARYREVLETRPARPFLLLRLVRASWPGFPGWAVAVGLTGALLGMVQAALFRGLLDAGLWLQTPALRAGAILAVLALAVVQLGIAWGWSVVMARLSRRLEVGLRRRVHEALPRIPERFFATRPTADVAERAHALVGLRLLPTSLTALLGEVAGLLMLVGGITVLDPSLLPWATLSAVVALGAAVLVHPFLASREMRRQTFDGALSRAWLDAMQGAMTVRAHGAEESLRREHEDVLVGWGQAGEEALRASVLASLLQGVLGIGLTAWMVGLHLATAEHTGATLLLVYWAIGLPRRGQSLAAAARMLPMQENLARRVLEILEAPEPDPGPMAEIPPGPIAIAIQDLAIGSPDDPILQIGSLTIPSGQHVAIVGPSGAGKSTLVGLLLGWNTLSSGRLLLSGTPVDRIDAQLRRRTAWVDPACQLWNDSLLGNLRYGAAPDADLDRILEEAGLLEILGSLPGGLASPLGENGGHLSGGQGQRVRLARALGRSPVDLALLDEPFRGLDRDARRQATARIRAWWEASTLLFVSHDVGDTLGFDRVLVVDGGRIVQDGPPADLLQTPGPYADLVQADRQARERFAGPGWRSWHLTRDGLAGGLP